VVITYDLFIWMLSEPYFMNSKRRNYTRFGVLRIYKFLKRSIPYLILFIGCVTAFLLNISEEEGVDDQHSLTAEVPFVDVIYPLEETKSLTVRSKGIVQAKVQLDIVSQVNGLVIEVADPLGSGVSFETGTVLVKLEDSDYSNNLILARSKVARAFKDLAIEKSKAKLAAKEWRDTGDKEANDLFLRKPHLVAMRAELESLKAQARQAEIELSRTVIVAPFDGIVNKMHTNVGQYVTVGTPLLTVFDSSIYHVRLPITSRQMRKLNLTGNDLSTNELQDIVVRFNGNFAGKAQNLNGRLLRLEADINATSRFYYLVAEIESEPNTPIVLGSLLNAEFQGRPFSNLVKLPTSALLEGTYLQTVSSQDTITLKEVDVISHENDYFWVTASFLETEPVIADTRNTLQVGSKINYDKPETVVSSLDNVYSSFLNMDSNTVGNEQ